MRRLLILALALAMSACGEENEQVSIQSSSSGGGGIAFSNLSASCFVPDPIDEAIITSDDFFVESNWNDPHVLKMDNQFVMYASSPTNEASNDVGIYRLISSDGKNWTLDPATAVLSHTESGWSSKAVETPAVVWFNSQYHLFYTGYDTNVSTQFRIGHATSPDGIAWTADANYLLEPGSLRGGSVTDFDYNIVGEPGPVVFNNTLFLYFTTMGYHTDIDDSDDTPGSQIESIGVITSTDAINWTQPQMAFRPDPSDDLYPRHQAGTNEYLGYSTPHAAVIEGRVVVFFDVINENPSWRQVELNFSYSEDGLTNWTRSPAGIFDINDFSWADEEVRSPAVFLDGTILHFWFAGHSLVPAPFTLGIGHAACDLES